MDDSRAWRQALTIIAGTTLLRLVVGALVPLFPDEAYYWDWSRTLEAGYFDHPPMIALLIRAGTTIFGYHAIGVRLFPILAGSGVLLAIASTARELAGDAAARLAVIVFACMPVAAVGLILATPDAPMLCAVAWSMYFVVRALVAGSEPGGRPVLLWCAAGATIGLAMTSKYTSVLFPAALLIAFVSHPRLQNKFGELGPYAAVVVAALVLAPVLWWNATHDWVSFRFQFTHGFGTPRGGVPGALTREAELLGGQILLVSPILFFFLVRAVRRAFEPTPDGHHATLAIVSVCCAAFFVYSATRRSVEANWPAVAYLPAVVLLAVDTPQTAGAARWLRRGIALGATLSLLILVHALVPVLPIPARSDQIAKAYGWDRLARHFESHRDVAMSRPSFGKTDLFFAAERYQDASELAFNLREHPRVFSLNLIGRANQYDLWDTFNVKATGGASLVLVLDDEPSEPRAIRKLTCCFQRIDRGEGVALTRGDQTSARKRLWFLQGWNGQWPRRDQPFPWVE